ncbi:hypothetical protein [Salinirubrum litoreum]|uniref:Uncharacterized protein n=1 Tax=Salinirubrum litoreum TaxID=1126234 RepID=A0ABD5RGP0_9EURY|nr:hypothetical protein [Salinirubrum litoreum]
MPSRRFTLVLVGLLLASGVSLAAGAVIDGPPTATFTNEDDESYRITMITPPDRHAALLTNVAVTTQGGDRQLVTVEDLVWDEPYRNASVADDVETSQIVVDPGETVTTSVESWEPGDNTVYLIERRAGPDSSVRADIVTCPQRQQEYNWTFENSGGSGSSVCASSLGWFLA